MKNPPPKKSVRQHQCQNGISAPEGLWVSLILVLATYTTWVPSYRRFPRQTVPDIPTLLLQSQRIYSRQAVPLASQWLHHGKAPISWFAPWFGLIFGQWFYFSSASSLSFKKYTEIRHLMSKDHIWRLLFFSTVLRMGTMCILIDSKTVSVPWWSFHIMWKISHCKALPVPSCFCLWRLPLFTGTFRQTDPQQV